MITEKDIVEIKIEYLLVFKSKFNADWNDFELLMDEIIKCSPLIKEDIVEAFKCYGKSLNNPFIDCKLNLIQKDIYYTIGRYFDKKKII